MEGESLQAIVRKTNTQKAAASTHGAKARSEADQRGSLARGDRAALVAIGDPPRTLQGALGEPPNDEVASLHVAQGYPLRQHRDAHAGARRVHDGRGRVFVRDPRLDDGHAGRLETVAGLLAYQARLRQRSSVRRAFDDELALYRSEQARRVKDESAAPRNTGADNPR